MEPAVSPPTFRHKWNKGSSQALCVTHCNPALQLWNLTPCRPSCQTTAENFLLYLWMDTPYRCTASQCCHYPVLSFTAVHPDSFSSFPPSSNKTWPQTSFHSALYSQWCSFSYGTGHSLAILTKLEQKQVLRQAQDRAVTVKLHHRSGSCAVLSISWHLPKHSEPHLCLWQILHSPIDKDLHPAGRVRVRIYLSSCT